MLVTTILDEMPGLVCTLDAAGELCFINRRVSEYFGRSIEELRGWRLADTVHPEDLPRAAAAHDAAMSSVQAFSFEHRCRRHDGVYRWFVAHASPFRDPRNGEQGWCVLLTDVDDRHRAEDALRAREQELHRIVDAMPVFAWSAATDGGADFFNRHFLEYVGGEEAELRGWGWTAAVHPEDLEPLVALWRSAMRSGTGGDAEARLRRHDGVYRWFLFRSQPLRDARGVVVKWYGTNTDIEDRRRAEQALRAQERELVRTINTIPVLAWCNLPDGSNEFLSQPWQDYTGLSDAEARGWGWKVAIHPDDLPRLLDYWSTLLGSGRPGQFEARLRRRDGQYRWFLFRVSPLHDEAGRIVRWYGTNTDIDDLKRVQVALARQEAQLAEGQRLSATGSFTWRPMAGDLQLSGELRRILEIGGEATVTLAEIRSRVHPDDLVCFDTHVEKARREATEVDHELRVRNSRGDRRLHIRASPRTSDGIGDDEYVGAVQDVTERREAEEALGRARVELARIGRVSAVGLLTASIAHEVNQPLSGIVTNASACLRMLAAPVPDLQAACETAKRTIRDANRASDVIKRLRQLFTRRQQALDVVDLEDAAREVLALMANDLRHSRIVLRTELAGVLPPVCGDRIQLQQVLMNLVMNAIDAMRGIEGRPRTLEVRTERAAQGGVRLTVHDSGRGIAAAHRDRLFEPFYTTKEDGMGIGLSISRSIVESHGGVLRYVEGEGATFALDLPAAEAAAKLA